MVDARGAHLGAGHRRLSRGRQREVAEAAGDQAGVVRPDAVRVAAGIGDVEHRAHHAGQDHDAAELRPTAAPGGGALGAPDGGLADLRAQQLEVGVAELEERLAGLGHVAPVERRLDAIQARAPRLAAGHAGRPTPLVPIIAMPPITARTPSA